MIENKHIIYINIQYFVLINYILNSYAYILILITKYLYDRIEPCMRVTLKQREMSLVPVQKITMLIIAINGLWVLVTKMIGTMWAPKSKNR